MDKVEYPDAVTDMQNLAIYMIALTWGCHKKNAFYDGRYYVVGDYLFSAVDMLAIKAYSWLDSRLEEMYNQYLIAKKVWQDTITR